MSEKKLEKKSILLKNMPIILKKEKLAYLKKELLLSLNVECSKRRFMPVVRPLPHIKEDIVYESQPGDFLKGEYQKITIVNKYNSLNNSSRTIAKFITHAGDCFEKTSDCITKLIGQANYDKVFSGLCSVISQENRIRGILALLTENIRFKDSCLQTDVINSHNIKLLRSNASCQTMETKMDIFNKIKPRRVKRQQLVPYVVKDTCPEPKKKLRKVIVNVVSGNMMKHQTENAVNSESIHIDPLKHEKDKFETHINGPDNSILPELEMDFGNSNDSVGKFSSLSVETTPELLNNPSLLIDVDRYTKHNEVFIEPDRLTELHVLKLVDNTTLLLPVKPEDVFHYATKENLTFLNEVDRKKLASYQAYMDFKYCLVRDENDNLPLHNAVLNDDLDLLMRQCFILNIKNTSVDTLANGLTALQMSMYKDTGQYTAMLLQYGADPLYTNENSQTSLHLAAELPSDHIAAVINHCCNNARNILEENVELWKPDFESKSDQELSKHLLAHMSRICDNQGYTPLMLASKLGYYNNVKQLLEIDACSINMPMPNSGNTALYLAVGAACTDAADRGNKSIVGNDFKRTIEILVENGGDPSFENLSGSSVNMLLTEFNNAELSMLLGNKLTSAKFPKIMDEINSNGLKNFDSFMIIKDEHGNENITEINREKGVFAFKSSSKKGNKSTVDKKLPSPKFSKILDGINSSCSKNSESLMIVNKEHGNKNKKVIHREKRVFGLKSCLKTGKKIFIDKSKPKIIDNVLLTKSPVRIEKNTNKIKSKPQTAIKIDPDNRIVDSKSFIITSKKHNVKSKSPRPQSLEISKIESPDKTSPYKKKTI